MMEKTEIARYELIKNIVIMSSTELYVELGTRRFEQINRIVPHVKKAVGVDVLDKWNDLKDPRVIFYKLTTDNLYTIWKEIDDNILIDTLFIDAEHSHIQSMKDFLNFSQFVKEDGIIILHDTYPPEEKYVKEGWCGDTYKTAWMIRTLMKDNYEIVTIPGSFGVSVIRKAKKQLLWKD